MSPRLPPPDSDLIERREILDAGGLGRTLRRMAQELVERIPREERPLYLVGVRTGGAYLAQRLCGLLAEAGEPRVRPKTSLRTCTTLALAALESAVQSVTKSYGAPDVAWGDVFRLREDSLDLPGNGASGAGRWWPRRSRSR